MEETTSNDKKRKVVWSIVEKPGQRPVWFKIGIAFVNQDNSLNIFLDAIPFERKLQVRDDDARQRPSSTAPERPDRHERALLPLESGGIPGSFQ